MDAPYAVLTPQITYYRVLKNNEVDPDYLLQYFRSQYFYDLLNLWGGSGSTRLYLSITGQSKLPIVYPDIAIQRKIAAVLTAYDDLIENNRQRIALLEQIAEEIYREWFVRLRFPGFEHTPIHKGVPEGWVEEQIQDAFAFVGGGTPSKKESRFWEPGEVQWFTPSDITSAHGIFLNNSQSLCSEEGLQSSSAKLFPAYSIMLTSRATIGEIGINTKQACTNQGFITCIPNERYPLAFLYHWLKLAKPHFEMLASGATFAELPKRSFKTIRILRPTDKLVARYESIAREQFNLMENLLQQNQQLTQTRNLLLNRLISSKLRVDNLDIAFPPSMATASEAETSADV